MTEEKWCSTCAFVSVLAGSTACCTCAEGGFPGYPNWKPRFDEERIDIIGPNGNEGLHYEEAAETTALDTQVGGGHYKKFAIQPAVFIEKNGLSFLEGCVVKRICRWKDKNGLEDLSKAKHEIDLLIEIHGVK